MSRPLTGKSHIGSRHTRQPNGDTYVFKRVTAYDAKTQCSYTQSQKLLGKIPAGASEMVPTRPKRRKGEKDSGGTVRKHTGLTDILEWVGKASGIDEDVNASFCRGDSEKIRSIARYWVGTNGNTLPRLESWQMMHRLPYESGISEDVYSDLFKSVGQNEDSVQRYFGCRCARLDQSPILAFDSTTLSTYSHNQLEARQGFNKDNDGLNTIKLLTLYSVKDREPLAFAKQPGNVPDVISIENAISQLKCFSLEKPLVVTDNGYCSQHNMMEFARRNMKFLTLADPDVLWVRHAVDSLWEEIGKMSNTCQFDFSVSGASTTLMHKFEYVRQRARNEKAAGQPETFERRLYVHVFHSSNNAAKKVMSFRHALMELKDQVESGVTEFTPTAQRKIDKYLQCSRLGRGGQMKVHFNDAEIAKAEKYFGYFALVGNHAMETFDALEAYRLREKIEELFGELKGDMDGTRPRVWYPDNLRGRQFVQFVGLGYRCFLAKKINEVKERLEISDPEKPKSLIRLEQKLKSWLEQHSMAQILDWFDCIETTTVQTPMATVRWSTESVARDQLFLHYLGMTPQ